MGINVNYWKDTLDRVEEDLRIIDQLLAKYTKPEDGYVIANDTYCDVGAGKGLNGTSVTMWSVEATVYPTKDEAYNNTDFYIIDGAGSPVIFEQRPACEYFDELRDCRLTTKDILERSNQRLQRKAAMTRAAATI